MTDGFAGPADAKTRRVLFRVLPVSLLLLVVSLLLFLWIANETLGQESERWDAAIRAVVHQFATPLLTSVMRGISFLGSGWVLLPASLIVLTFLVVQGRRRDAIVLAATMTGALLLETTLKLGFHRARPEPFFQLPVPKTYAFPSGHALVSLCFYVVIVWIFSEQLKDRRWRLPVRALATVLIALIGLSRIYLGVHYPSDVLAGYAAAIVWMSTIRLVMRKRNA